MAEDIKGEVESKYGPVRKIKVDKMSRVSLILQERRCKSHTDEKGDVYIEFDSSASAGKAHQGLGGRFFGGRQLSTAYITEAIFKAHL
jgi:RNA-binding protein 39